MAHNSQQPKSKRYLLYLTLGALGVVYGDIGTSPLYAFRECFSGAHGLPVTHDNVLGILSLIVWSLLLVVSLKYIIFVMRADNRGEGGALALTALILPYKRIFTKKSVLFLEVLGVFGAALIYGDGMVTPAISVLSAVEGLKIVTPLFEPYVVMITVIILIALFLMQRKGTEKMGRVFGPVILIWFITLGVLGFKELIKLPSIIAAFNPWYAGHFLYVAGFDAFKVLGAVFLAVTGAEALFADMGHFGKRPIRLGWFCVALPGLLLNYFGQGALLLTNPESVNNPFFYLAPSWGLIPLVILSTAAAVIASQALISGAFSLTSQAVQLGYLPRLQIIHTSAKEKGQIYIPLVNVILLISTVLLVVNFRSSSNLAAAYGIAVALTMVVTTTLVTFIAVQRWRWSSRVTLVVAAFFLIVDLAFLGSNLLKIQQGGWVPLVVALGVYILMVTWRDGRLILAEVMKEFTPALERFIPEVKEDYSIRVPGTAIFMTRNIDRTPPALLTNLLHNKVVHKTAIMLMVVTDDQPYVSDAERLEVKDLGDGFWSVIVHYGFTELADIPKVLKRLEEYDLKIDPEEVTFFLGRETLLPTDQKDGMYLWREHLFSFMSKNAQRATAFYNIPAGQVIEIGCQVEL